MKRKRCEVCGKLSSMVEKYNGTVRCYPCGRIARIKMAPWLFPEEAKAMGLITDN